MGKTSSLALLASDWAAGSGNEIVEKTASCDSPEKL